MCKNTIGLATSQALDWELSHRFHKHSMRVGTAVRIPTDR